MNKKNIIFFANLASFGGVETVALVLCSVLKNNYNIKIISPSSLTPETKSILTQNNIDYLECQKFHGLLKGVKKKLQYHKISQYIKTADILIDYKNGCGYKFYKNDKQPKKILWIHGGLPFVLNNKFDFSLYDKIVLLTDSLTQSLQAMYPEFASRFLRIYNPTDFAAITLKSQEDVASSPYRNLLQSNYMVHVSRLDEDKDLMTVIKAYGLYLSHSPAKFKLVLVGDGTERKNIETEIKKRHLEDNIILAGYQENPYIFMKYAKAVILSSPSEGLPCVLIEALAVTKGIVVASDCPNGPREILNNGKFGILFDVGNEKQLSAIFADIEAQTVSKASATDISQHLKQFSLNKNLAATESLIESLTSSPQKPQ